MYNKGLQIINKKGKEKNDKIAQKVIEIALHSVLFHFFPHQLTSGYSISLITDPARRPRQLYLRVEWTSAFNQFFVFVYVHFNLFIDCNINSYTNPYNLAFSRLL